VRTRSNGWGVILEKRVKVRVRARKSKYESVRLRVHIMRVRVSKKHEREWSVSVWGREQRGAASNVGLRKHDLYCCLPSKARSCKRGAASNVGHMRAWGPRAWARVSVSMSVSGVSMCGAGVGPAASVGLGAAGNVGLRAWG
jgi:hypothetical protein